MNNTNAPSYLGKYEVQIPDTPIQIVTNKKNAQLELTEHFLKYHIAFDSDGKKDVDDYEWKKEYSSWRVTAKRKNISVVSMYWHQPNKLWAVEIGIMGSSNDIQIFFVEYKEGKEMFDRLETYYLETV